MSIQLKGADDQAKQSKHLLCDSELQEEITKDLNKYTCTSEFFKWSIKTSGAKKYSFLM